MHKRLFVMEEGFKDLVLWGCYVATLRNVRNTNVVIMCSGRLDLYFIHIQLDLLSSYDTCVIQICT